MTIPLKPGTDEIAVDRFDLPALRELLAGVVDFADPAFQKQIARHFNPRAMPETLRKGILALSWFQQVYPNLRLTPDNVRRMAEFTMGMIGLIEPTPEILQDLQALPPADD